MPPSPVRSPLEAVHRLSRGLGQVHLTEVSQGGDIGHATVAAREGPALTRYFRFGGFGGFGVVISVAV